MLNAVRIWILLSTLLIASGWILSAFHELNRAGYAVVFALAAAALLLWQRKTGWRESPAQWLRKFKRRFRRPAPLMFLVLAVMSLVAGALYPPLNHDSCEYRIPRVWHWLAAGHWHWIHTLDFRMNVAGCNYEWLMTPLMLFTRYDRTIFLVNWVSYLMLPGLIFSVFTRLQVRRRVAWWWMWLLPAGLCYVLQAGSEVNDSFAVIYALASVDFALRAREKNSLPDVWLSILAVALLTGAKQTNLALPLLWLVAIIPCLRLIKTNVLATAGVCVLALLPSALPVTYFNLEHAGNWMGFPATTIFGFGRPENPGVFWAVIGNAFCLPVQNLVPPYFPLVHQWNAAMRHFLLTPLGSHFQKFESFGSLPQGESEPDSGIGLWIFLLTMVSICAARFYRQSEPRLATNELARWLRWIPYVSLVIYMAKVVNYQNARYLSPYYVFLFPAILVAGGHAALARKKWWQYLGLAVMLMTAAVLVVSGGRPLFPAATIFLPLMEKHPQWHLLAKAWNSYEWRLSNIAQRNAFRDVMPADERVLGYATLRGSQEAGQWVPFGHRRVERVLPDDNPAELQAKGIHYVLVDSAGLASLSTTIGEWTNHFDGVVVDSMSYKATPDTTETDYLVRLSPPEGKMQK